MAIDPATATIIASAIASAAKGAGEFLSSSKQKKAAKEKSKESNRETHAGLLNGVLQRNTESQINRSRNSKKLHKRKSQSLQDTADLVREAFKL